MTTVRARLPAKGAATVLVGHCNVARMCYSDLSDGENARHTASVAGELLHIAKTKLRCSSAAALDRLPVARRSGLVGPTPAYIIGATEDGPITSAPGFAVCLAKTPKGVPFVFFVENDPDYVDACGLFGLKAILSQQLQDVAEKS
jgi:hypothetical protein